MNPQLFLWVMRVLFVLIAGAVGLSIALGLEHNKWSGLGWGTLFGVAVVGADLLLKNLTIRGFSSATFGLLIGVLCAWLLSRIEFFPEEMETAHRIFPLMLYLGLGFLGMSLAVRSNSEEFSFIIPYVRFRQEGVHGQPLIVDTNIIIDGRIPAIFETGFLSGKLVVPRFILDELHILADSADAVKKERGQRGLLCLEEIENTPGIEVVIHEDYQPREKLVDTKLMQLAKVLGARLLTNDSNLGKVAELQGIAVLNLNQLAKAMRPTITPGDEMELTLVKEGKDEHQAVGYLPDGTMIVVNNGMSRIGSTVDIVVGGSLQTSAGRLIFAELKDGSNGAPQRS